MPVSEKALANLRPQKTGEPSHNPKGRPKKELCITSIVKELLEAEVLGNHAVVAEAKNLVLSEWKIADPTWLQMAAALWILRSIDFKQPPAYFLELIGRVDGKAVKLSEADSSDDELTKKAKLILLPHGNAAIKP